MSELVDRRSARGGVQVAPRPSSSPTSRRGPDAPDADGLRSPSRWFGRSESMSGDLPFRTGSGWTTDGTRARPIVVAKVGSPTGSDWRHPAVQLR